MRGKGKERTHRLGGRARIDESVEELFESLPHGLTLSQKDRALEEDRKRGSQREEIGDAQNGGTL
jgi:hypothetical protein